MKLMPQLWGLHQQNWQPQYLIRELLFLAAGAMIVPVVYVPGCPLRGIACLVLAGMDVALCFLS